MATCLRNMHQDAVWVLHYNAFWAAVSRGTYLHSYGTGDVRIVTPGIHASGMLATTQSFESPGNITEPSQPTPAAINNDKEGVVLSPPQLTLDSHQLANMSTALSVLSVPSDPASVLKDISNAFATAGAIADFFGPEGEVVGLVLQFVASIFNLISGLLGLGKPDPVIQQLRTLEKDIMGRLSAVSDSIEKAKSQAQLGAIAVTLNNAESPLLNIVRSP